MHSIHSDGENTPSELVEMAAELGIRAISLTDHDSLEGMDEAMRVGFEKGIEVIPGVELSVKFGKYKDIHLIGYYVNWRDERLNERLRGFREAREARGERIVERINDRLAQEGHPPIDFASVKKLAGGAIGRPHIARVLIDAGAVPDVERAFQRYLTPYNVPKAYFTPEEAAEMVGEAGGLLVLAHPLTYTEDREELETLIQDLHHADLDGIEAIYSKFTANEISDSLYLARKFGLIPTGGSDYHGPSFPYGLGVVNDSVSVPYETLIQLRKRYFQKNPTLIVLLGLRGEESLPLLTELASQSGAHSLTRWSTKGSRGIQKRGPGTFKTNPPGEGDLSYLHEAEEQLRKGRSVILSLEDVDETGIEATEKMVRRLSVKGCFIRLGGGAQPAADRPSPSEKGKAREICYITHGMFVEGGREEMKLYCQWILHLVAVSGGNPPSNERIP